MSLLEAQEWINQRLDIDEHLYAVIVQCESGDEAVYRMVSVIDGKTWLDTWITDADWKDYILTRGLAADLIGHSFCIKNKKYEVTRVFIVEKDTGYRIIEEVTIDAA